MEQPEPAGSELDGHVIGHRVCLAAEDESVRDVFLVEGARIRHLDLT
jgi:hypothetical protein